MLERWRWAATLPRSLRERDLGSHKLQLLLSTVPGAAPRVPLLYKNPGAAGARHRTLEKGRAELRCRSALLAETERVTSPAPSRFLICRMPVITEPAHSLTGRGGPGWTAALSTWELWALLLVVHGHGAAW